MSNEFWYRVLISIAILMVTDVLLYFGLRRLFRKSRGLVKPARKFTWFFVMLSLVFMAYATVHYFYLQHYGVGAVAYRQYFIITGAFILIYIPKLVMLAFIVFEALLLFLLQLLSFVFQHRSHYEFVKKVRRFKFFSWMGFILGLLLFGYILYGMLVTRTDYKVQEVALSFKNLPPAFNGVKIVQLSDVHLGSFYSEKELGKAIELLKAINPDMILFTGDMVNVSALETAPYQEVFSSLKPPLGMFAVLGNHDQDDYMKLSPGIGREKMEAEVAAAERKMGFNVLRNQNQYIYKGTDSIALIGVDSWGLQPFRCYGDLPKALNGVDKQSFKILLSHIPSHWVVEVRGKTDIDLTLAGHTHAAQIGVEFGSWHWSPIVFKYPHYMGLYPWGTQYLYVNPGLGYLGFPGRIGIRPEITVFTLSRTGMKTEEITSNSSDSNVVTNIP